MAPAVEDTICMIHCYVNAAKSLSLGLTTRWCSSTSSRFSFFFAGIQVAGNSPKAEQHACNRGRAAVINIPTNIKNIMNNESISMLQNHNHCNGRDRLKYWQIEAAKFRVKMAVKHLIWCNSERLKQIIHIISSTGNEKSYCPLVPTECQVGSEDSPAACQDHHLLTTSCPLSPWSSNPPSQEANLLVHSLLNQPKQEPTVFERSAKLNFVKEIILEKKKGLFIDKV